MTPANPVDAWTARRQPPKNFACRLCFDTGLVLLTTEVITGIAQLLDKSMPCTCVAGDEMRGEYGAA